MLRGINGRLTLTRHPTHLLKMISTPQEIIMDHRLMMMLVNSFNHSIINNHQGATKSSILTKEVRGINSLGNSGLKMQLKLHMQEKKGISKIKINSKRAQSFLGLRAHLKAIRKQVKDHNLIKREIQTGERELQEHLLVPMNFKFQTD